MKVRRLGDLEAEIMDRLWRWQRPAGVRELVDDLNRSRPIAYTTVKTVADILAGKGLLERIKDNRAWLYRTVLSREQYTAALMHDALAVSPDRQAALAQFLEQSSDEDVAAIRALLRRPDADEPR